MNAPDFAGASREVLSFLHQRIGMDLWLVTRADNEDWVVLAAEGPGYGVGAGDVFRWADTFCSRMVSGDGPRVAPQAADVPAYAALPITAQLPVGAYLGVPLVDGEGRLFGTLCGLSPHTMPPSLVEELALVEVFADMLSGLLSAELASTALVREAATARSEALTDALTGLANHRGWELALAAEEERCRRYGATACVLAMALDGVKPPADTPAAAATQRAARDAALLRAAHVLRQTVRKPDTLARLADDRFVVLGVECTTAEAMALLRRVELGLQGAGLSAALGMAMRHRSSGLFEAVDRALDAMAEHGAARARD
jgi:diguanylate cyclase (GGDEF)-like protein